MSDTSTNLEAGSQPQCSIQPLDRSFHFNGTGGELFSIFVRNFFLSLATLGIYTFWGKVRIRRYIWAHSFIEGNAFCYHGNGKELQYGWIKAGLLFCFWFFALDAPFIFLSGAWQDLVFEVIFYLGMGLLIPLAQIGSMRYRLSRTSLCGIRFSFRGRYLPLLWITLRGYLLTGLTFGFYYPELHRQVRIFFVQHSYWGNIVFRFTARENRMLWYRYRDAFLINLGLGVFVTTLVAFGFIQGAMGFVLLLIMILAYQLFAFQYWVKYWAERRRWYWANTKFVGASFRSTVDDISLFRLYMENTLLMLCTVGLAAPWVKARTKRYDLAHLSLQDGPDFHSVVQDQQAGNASSDELAGFLDMDVVVG